MRGGLLWMVVVAAVAVVAMLPCGWAAAGEPRQLLPGEVLYVRAGAPPGGDGLDWAAAHADLQDALGAAREAGGAVKEIWVAAGTYKPDRGTGDRSATFQLVNGVALYGGFQGDEAQREQRDPVANETILSGDLAGDDGEDFANNAENTQHVVTGSGSDQTATLDGFTLTAGNADGTGDAGTGGRLLCVGGSPTIRNCRFAGSAATEGGGIRLRSGCQGAFEECVVAGNKATMLGGGMSCSLLCTPTLKRCVFEHNVAYEGGGLHCHARSDAMLSECTFRANRTRAPTVGGGVLSKISSPVISRCTFDANESGSGAALECSSGGHVQVVDSLFFGNVATSEGGAVRVYSSAQVTLDRCRLIGNTAESGGAMRNFGGLTPLLRSCLIAGNRATSAAGGIMTGSDLTIKNCTIVDNEAAWGGGIYAFTGRLTLTDSIVWGNVAWYAQDVAVSRICTGVASATIAWCDIRGGREAVYVHPDSTLTWGEGNIAADPLFVDAANGNYQLLPLSLCLNAGDPEYVAADGEADLDGQARVAFGRVDMGADEFHLIRLAGDADRNGVVDVFDVVLVVSAFGLSYGQPGYNVLADLDASGDVGVFDVIEVITHFGQSV